MLAGSTFSHSKEGPLAHGLGAGLRQQIALRPEDASGPFRCVHGRTHVRAASHFPRHRWPPQRPYHSTPLPRNVVSARWRRTRETRCTRLVPRCKRPLPRRRTLRMTVLVWRQQHPADGNRTRSTISAALPAGDSRPCAGKHLIMGEGPPTTPTRDDCKQVRLRVCREAAHPGTIARFSSQSHTRNQARCRPAIPQTLVAWPVVINCADCGAVVLIKNLKVKGSMITLKQGSKVKSIRLVGDCDQKIDCKFDEGKLMLEACFLKKV